MTYSEAVKRATADPKWQEFRKSLKGTTTEVKLERLWDYYVNAACHIYPSDYEPCGQCDICVQVDNYIKALCRGGQLYPGESLWTVFESQFNVGTKIKRN